MERISGAKQAAAEAAEQEAARAAGSAAEARLRLSEHEQQLPQQQRRIARPEVSRAAVTSGLLLLTTLLLSQGACFAHFTLIPDSMHCSSWSSGAKVRGRLLGLGSDSVCLGTLTSSLQVPQQHCRQQTQVLLQQQPACAAGLQQDGSLTPSARRHRHRCIPTASTGSHGQVETAMHCTQPCYRPRGCTCI